jgi:hypothetical protein
MLEEVCGKAAMKKIQVYGLHEHFRDEHETYCLFCTTTPLHIGRRWSKSILPSKSGCFTASAIFPELVTGRLFSVSITKKCSERTTILECRGSLCKSDEREVSRNAFQECLQKTLKVGKSVSLLKGTILEEVLCK